MKRKAKLNTFQKAEVQDLISSVKFILECESLEDYLPDFKNEFPGIYNELPKLLKELKEVIKNNG